jgi:hypothetical protein
MGPEAFPLTYQDNFEDRCYQRAEVFQAVADLRFYLSDNINKHCLGVLATGLMSDNSRRHNPKPRDTKCAIFSASNDLCR